PNVHSYYQLTILQSINLSPFLQNFDFLLYLRDKIVQKFVLDLFLRYQSRYQSLECELHYLIDLSERSEEHTSELQSRFDLVCRLLLEKKKLRRTQLRC